MANQNSNPSPQITLNPETVTGTAADDEILAAPGGLGAGDRIDGGDGYDTIRLTAPGTLDITLPDVFTGIERLEGSSGDDLFLVSGRRMERIDEIQGGDGMDTVRLKEAGALKVAWMISVEKVEGSAGDDHFYVGADNATKIDGGDGHDVVEMMEDGTLDLRLFSGMEAVVGFDGADLFQVAAGNTIRINGGGGTDTVRLENAGLLDLGAFSNIRQVIGSAGDDVFLYNPGLRANIDGGDGQDVLRLAGPGTLDLARLPGLSNIETVEGSSGSDIFIVPADGTLIVDGGYGFDTVRLTGEGKLDTTLFRNIERFIGSDGKDILIGTDGDAGDDSPADGSGDGWLRGGDGDDLYRIDNLDDIVEEEGTGGIDTIEASVSFSLADRTRVKGQVENLTLTGKAIFAIGNELDNQLKGNAMNNRLEGAAGSDRLDGGQGHDRLVGGLGRDTLTGGTGKDIFRFDTRPAKDNVDTITDFNVKDDTIELENAIFAKLKKTGVLAKTFLAVNAAGKAMDKDDYLVYSKKTGLLSYDPDGSGKAAAVEIAYLSKNLPITEKDFLIT